MLDARCSMLDARCTMQEMKYLRMYMALYHETGSRVFTEEILNGGKIHKKKYRHYADINTFFTAKPQASSDLKVIAMSDIHSITDKVITDLIRKKHINKNTIVITTGDMAGNGRSGAAGDDNPYDSYVKILKAAHSLYLVIMIYMISVSSIYAMMMARCVVFIIQLL